MNDNIPDGFPHHLVRVVPPGKPVKFLKDIPKRLLCPKTECKFYEPGLSPGTDTCIGCARSYLTMPDKFVRVRHKVK